MKYDIRSTQGDVLGHIELADGLEVVARAAAAPSAPPAPPQVEEVKTMTDAAGSFTYDQYREMGWSDNALLAHGLMKIELREKEQPGQVHPSVANQQLGDQWQPEPAPPVPEAPAAPSVPPVPAAPQATPEPPKPPQAAPEPPAAPSVPGVPTPPPAPGAPAAPQPNVEGAAANLPDGLREVESVPHVQGREFMIRGRSFEKVVDRDHVPFDARIRGLTKDNLPATKQDGTFKKKRGVANEEYEAILAQLTGDAQQPQSAPTPPPAPGAPSVPDVPSAPAAPQTAPPQPDNMDALKDALSDWGEEI